MNKEQQQKQLDDKSIRRWDDKFFTCAKRTDTNLSSYRPIILSSFKRGFTLAEVLITLSIIGVVAAITMPILITNTTERRNSERHANIAYKVTQAMEHMRATGKLVPYDSTESFVNELQKHLKISKICDKDHLTDCWPTDKVTDKAGNEYNVADAKTGASLGLGTETNNVGIVLADGAALILNYDPNTQGLDIGDRVTSSTKELPIGNGKTKKFAYTSSVTGPIDFVMDVNGSGKPNREMDTANNKYYDIRSFTAATFTTPETPNVCAGEYDESAGCIIYVGTTYDAVNCVQGNPSYAGDSICGPHPSGYSSDYWAGAKAKCRSYAGFDLPSESDLKKIQANRANYPSLASNTNWFWSADELSSDPQGAARLVNFFNGLAGYSDKSYQRQVVCLGN